jgi:hypothetical protein
LKHNNERYFNLLANADNLNKQVSILKALNYFSLFNYPLTKEELVFFLNQKIGSVELSDALNHLKHSGLIFQTGQFYSLQDEASIFESRIKGNLKAIPLLVRAEKISRLLFSFPFVRAIFISGSLSKNFAGEDADIDFFIITTANRLWIARTLMHILKKISFALHKEHLLCMNYYIDEENLRIIEQNEYTATEILTLMPYCGRSSVKDFFKANNWVNFYYPNYEIKNIQPRTVTRNNFVKTFFEHLLDNRMGNMIDDHLMNITNNRWKRKESVNRINKKGRKMGIRAGKHFCKPNPDYFQKKMLGQYSAQLNDILKRFEKANAEQKSTFLN